MTARVAACAALALAISCGPSARPRPEPSPRVQTPARDAGRPSPDTPPPVAPSPPPCVASPPTRESLAALAQPGVLRVDATAPQHTGECVSPASIARDGELVECDATGTRCRAGAGRVLIARELEGACAPLALVTYDGEVPEAESEAVLASLAQRPEACALHDLVATGAPAFYDVDRARQVAPGRGGALVSTCVHGVPATAAAEAARADWREVPLACSGLRCRDVTDAASPRWLFANRVSGPLRFDAVAVGELPDVLAQLRRRCR